MPSLGTCLLTLLTMVLFAANSLLCRAALRRTGIDPASFTTIRILCAALATWALVACRRSGARRSGAGRSGSWRRHGEDVQIQSTKALRQQ